MNDLSSKPAQEREEVQKTAEQLEASTEHVGESRIATTSIALALKAAYWLRKAYL